MGRGGFQPFETSIRRTIPIDKKIKTPSLSLSPAPVRSSRGESGRASSHALEASPAGDKRSLERNDSVARQEEHGF